MIKIMLGRTYNRKISEAQNYGAIQGYNRAIIEIREELKGKENVYLEPVNIYHIGSVTVENCAFIGIQELPLLTIHTTGIK
jgi:hypothetical protein